jgi:hypothetical protein
MLIALTPVSRISQLYQLSSKSRLGLGLRYWSEFRTMVGVSVRVRVRVRFELGLGLGLDPCVEDETVL